MTRWLGRLPVGLSASPLCGVRMGHPRQLPWGHCAFRLRRACSSTCLHLSQSPGSRWRWQSCAGAGRACLLWPAATQLEAPGSRHWLQAHVQSRTGGCSTTRWPHVIHMQTKSSAFYQALCGLDVTVGSIFPWLQEGLMFLLGTTKDSYQPNISYF